LFSRYGWFKRGAWRTVVAVFIMTVVTIGTAAPISVFLFSGISGNGGSSLIIAGLQAAGNGIWSTVLSVDGATTIADRIVTQIIVMLIIIVIPHRTLIKFSCGEQYIKKAENQ